MGANLDVNSKTITSASNGNVDIDPDGTGFVNIDDFMETLETLELEFDEK